MADLQIRYPIFVLSKGRWQACQTVQFLLKDQVPFRLVVEPAEAEAYRQAFPTVQLLVTPRDNMRLLGARNWVRRLSVEEGHERHWQLDDNMHRMWRLHHGLRLPVDSRAGFAAMEQFTDRYSNIGLSGPNYLMFARSPNAPPFRINVHVYSCTLINNSIPCTWRLLYNDDTDLCLQVLSAGLCTVQFNAFLVQKIATMKVKGGNTDDLYQGDGRLTMSRSLEKQWPGIVTTTRKFGRPQHHIKANWKGFDTPLIRRDDLDWDAIKDSQWTMTLKKETT